MDVCIFIFWPFISEILTICLSGQLHYFSCFKLIGLSKYLAGCEGEDAMRFAFSAALGYVAQVSSSPSDIRLKVTAEMIEFRV